jgi:hypothetical protein
MPVIGSGNFTLYGFALTDPGGLVDGEPPDGAWHIKNTGFVPTFIPCVIGWTGPAFLDTNNHGTGFAAGSPPNGFNLKTRPLFTGPILHPGYAGVPPINNAANYDMGGKLGLSGIVGSGIGFGDCDHEQNDSLLLYIELLTIHIFRVTALNGAPYDAQYRSKTAGPSSAPSVAGQPSPDGPSITGAYVIIAWWWVLPDVDDCGNQNTTGNHDTSQTHLILSTTQPPDGPNGPYVLFDPEDPDNGHPTPVIDTVDPNHGPRGTEVTIRGTGFGDGANVQFDGVDAIGIVVVNQYTITCSAPAHALGYANIHVINADGVSS